jgi:hypothetical protein
VADMPLAILPRIKLRTGRIGLSHMPGVTPDLHPSVPFMLVLSKWGNAVFPVAYLQQAGC